MKKVYVEITNRCNLRCAFCPGTGRAEGSMSPEEFALVLDRLGGRAEYVFLHVMGEPLLHPALETILALAAERNQKLCVATNGTLLPRRAQALLDAPTLYRVSVSLHCLEGNGVKDTGSYLEAVWDFAQQAAERGVIVALRLWNEGGAEARNGEILSFLHEKTGQADWPEPRSRSYRLGERLYLEREHVFRWPDAAGEETGTQFCRALREQLGVLCDGTVVPCCLDSEGTLALGNLFEEELDTILAGARAQAIRAGFSRRQPAEALCRRCGYATRFNV